MITDEQARAAAERIRDDGDDTFASTACYWESSQRDDDMRCLSEYALQELSRREQHDDGPITAEWLESIGWLPDLTSEPGAYASRIWGLSDVDGDDDPHFHLLFAPDSTLWLECYDGGGNTLGLCDLMQHPTKAQLRAVVAALKGGKSPHVSRDQMDNIGPSR